MVVEDRMLVTRLIDTLRLLPFDRIQNLTIQFESEFVLMVFFS